MRKRIGFLLAFMCCIIFMMLAGQDFAYAELDKDRIAGIDRYATAVEISREGWSKSYFAVLVSGESLADAVCSVPLANKLAAPILLTEGRFINDETLTELKRLGAEHIYIIGGTQVIASDVVDRIRQAGISKIERVCGSDRYETSVEIAKKLDTKSRIIVVSWKNPWDVLALSSIASKKEIPILITNNDKLPQSVQHYLRSMDYSMTYLIGGTGVISTELERSVPGPIRIGGKNRYETNALILKQFAEELDFNKIYAVSGGSGGSFTDALSAGVLAAKGGFPLILIDESLMTEICNSISSNITSESRLIIIGGEKAVPQGLLKEFKDFVQKINVTAQRRSNISNGIGVGDPGTQDDSNDLPPDCKVSKVYSGTTDGSYKVGDIIELTIKFTFGVEVTGVPILRLETGVIDRDAVYTGGSGTTNLTFAYTIQQGDESDDLCYLNKNSLNLNGGEIKLAGRTENANLILPDPGELGSLSQSSNIVIDTTAPSELHISHLNRVAGKGSVTITAIGGPLSDTSWKDILNLIKANTEAGSNWITGINADDLSLIPAKDGVSAILANSDDSDAGIGADFIFPAGKVVDRAGNTAIVDIIVDSFIPISVCAVNSSVADKSYKPGDVIDITVAFTGEVDVNGVPELQLETGATDRKASYLGGTGSDKLTFKYTVQPGDTAADLDYLGINALSLNGGSIRVSGTLTDALLVLPVPSGAGSLGGTKNIIIDTAVPSAINISDQNKIPSGCSITLEAVNGPLSDASWTAIMDVIKVNTGGGINWITGVNSHDLSISPSADGVSAAISNNSGSSARITADFFIPNYCIEDRAGNVAAGNITINSYNLGMVTTVRAVMNGFYKAGSEIFIEVTYDVPIYVPITGVSPSLLLETGSIDRLALYTAMKDANTLKFKYIVQPGDSSLDLDYISKGALTGTINVLGKNTNVSLTLPAPGEDGSLGRNNNIIIDTVAPTAINISQQNIIPAGGSVTLTSLGEPLASDSWNNILSVIKSKTIKIGVSNWIRNINSNNLSITKAPDGLSATLNNDAGEEAIIYVDFIIPAGKVFDKAGNTADTDIRINACTTD